MDDSRIVDLFWARDERAISETSIKYGAYCTQIAHNILHNLQDAEECVNDTYLRTWNAIPPSRPTKLGAFVGKITRRLALDKFKARSAEKRKGDTFGTSLEELGECIPSREFEEEESARIIGEAINGFLKKELPTARKIFVCRYFYGDSIEDICQRFDMTEAKVKSSLFRSRRRLRAHLEKEGIGI
ncbi:MAG: RNA polymerase sigma factor [Clostridia bacterium]|nr:RNA polymerase sigma factor [Clostridia bacterium]